MSINLFSELPNLIIPGDRAHSMSRIMKLVTDENGTDIPVDVQEKKGTLSSKYKSYTVFFRTGSLISTAPSGRSRKPGNSNL